MACKAQSTGQISNPWSQAPICQFRTAEKSIHNFSFHKTAEIGSNGNTLIIGGTGSGKTTLTSFLLAQAAKIPELRTICFDHYSGMKISTESQGGSYLAFSDEKNQINPLHLENTEENRKFILRWISNLVGAVSDADLKDLEMAIMSMMAMEYCDRTLYNLAEAIASTGTLSRSLQKWVQNGQNANYFEGDFDCLDFSNRRLAFDMEKLIDKPDVLKAMCEYLFYRISCVQRDAPSPGIIFFDEASIYLKHDLLGEIALNAFRTYRKRNWIVTAAIQSLEDMAKLSRGQSVIDNIETFILYPTPSANVDLYTDLLSLTKQEYRWLIEPHFRKVLVKKKDRESFILDVDLSPLGDQIKYFDSNAQAVKNWELEKQDNTDWSFNFPSQLSFFVKVPADLSYDPEHIGLGAKRALVSDLSDYVYEPQKNSLLSDESHSFGQEAVFFVS